MRERTEILAGLDSPQEELRLESVRDLVKTGGLDAAKHLRRVAAGDPSAQVRYYAQKGLEHLSRRLAQEEGAGVSVRGKTDILDRLAGILAGTNRDVKLKALQVLALHGFKESLPTVLEHYPKETDPFVRSKMLVNIGMLGGRGEIPILAAATDDADFRIRANAVEALEYIGHRSIYPTIIRLLQDPDHRVRANAVKALRNYGRAQVLAVLDEMLGNTEVRARDSALFACLTFDAEVSVPRLAKLLDDPAGPIRQKAFHALSRLAERGCEPASKVLAGRRVEGTDQEKLLDYFTLLDQALTLDEDLPTRLGHTDFRVRLAAVHQILKDNRAQYLQLLSDRLAKETDGYVKATLVTAVGKLGGLASMGELLPFLSSDDPRLRANAVEALGWLRMETLYPKLRPFLEDPNNRARGNALIALKDDPETDHAAVLAGLLGGDELMRLTACYAVAQLGREDLVGQLEGLLDDSSEKVRAKVYSTLSAMSGQSDQAQTILARHTGQGNLEVVLAREFEPTEAGRVKSSLEVEKLLFDLKSVNPVTRMDAIRLLADIGDLTAVEPLAQSIRAEGVEERMRSRQAIVTILLRQEREQRGSGALDATAGAGDPMLGAEVERLLAGAENQEAAVSAVLRLALAEGRRPVIRGLRDRFKAGPDSERLRVLLVIAGLLGSTEILLRYLDHEVPVVKQMAREGLEAISGDQALAAVIPHVRSTSRTVRHNAVRALRLFPKAKVLQVCRHLLRSSEPKARESGIYILTKLEYDQSFEMLVDYFRAEEDLDLARKAAGTIAKLATPADRRMIETLLDGSGNEGRAELAHKILSKLPGQADAAGPGAMPGDSVLADESSPDVSQSGILSSEQRQQFVDDLSNQDSEVRKAALTELARTRDLSLMPLIRKVAFTDPDSRVAFFAKNTHDNMEMAMLPHLELKKQGEAEFSLGRFTGYMESADPRVRVAAIKKAVTHAEKKVVPLLTKKLKDEEDEWVLASLLMALGELGDRKIGGSMVPFLKRKDPRLRSVAIASIAELKDDSVFPLITPALLDEDGDVAEVAFMSLKRLAEDDLVDYVSNMCEARRAEQVERGTQLLLRLATPKALAKQLELLGRSADKVLLTKLTANLVQSGSREILFTLVERVESMAFPRNEYTDRIERELLKALGLTRDDVKAALEEQRTERKRSRSLQAAAAASAQAAAAAEGGVVGKLKGLFWKK